MEPDLFPEWWRPEHAHLSSVRPGFTVISCEVPNTDLVRNEAQANNELFCTWPYQQPLMTERHVKYVKTKLL